ncbi:L,D-transpeptidase family protein [Levilactobacillus bambusae]|uniref:L,D-TPase catalytic domain-containing protein n=1 Tax=Levilactobacillus bambusae TaxID=2024736 RepID=A0A2V1MVY1_9LACO|nr:L,D-transpeptidase family protein [Levilactobacillus bambusae]PWF99303.1 hypothetical protein DCM90_09350 [Levilactobacillus bambusae]
MKTSRSIRIGLLALILLAGGVYAGKAMAYQHSKTFFKNTVIAGVNVGGQTAQAATQSVNRAIANRQYTIQENGQSLARFSARKAGLKLDVTTTNQLLANQNAWAWPAHLTAKAAGNDNQLTLDNHVTNRITRQIVQTTNQSPNRTAAVNATLVYHKGHYQIRPAKNGTRLDETAVQNSIQRAVANGQTTINVDHDYVRPAVTSNSKTLKQLKQKAEKITNATYTYKIEQHRVTIPQQTVASWLTTSGKKLTVNQAAVQTYLTSLNNKYATNTKTRTFKSTTHGTVTVKAGLYGWHIPIISEAQALTPILLKGQSTVRKPLITGSGYHADGTDIGNSYVEVSLASQHMWVYKDGKQVVSTDVVTGLPKNDHSTPTGVWVVWSKQSPSILKGKNDNGSNYSSKVQYWMPVDDTGVGIHDSSWQPKYGGDWYLTHGSHGCVNTPPSVMGKVYQNVAVGTPVIIF